MNATQLLLDLSQRGIRLEADGERLRYFPRSMLTPDLLDRLRGFKAELLAMLRPTAEAASAPPAPMSEAAAKSANMVCRCGSTTWRDVPIHGGRSVRRDCDRCGRFIEFPVWYGKDNLQNEY